MAWPLLRLAASLVLCVVMATSAGGADSRSLPAFRSAVFDWEGPYGGVVVALESFEARVQGLSTQPHSINGNGEIAGFIVGYNAKRRNWVFGAEAGISFGEIEARSGATTIEADFVSTIRGRLGRSHARALPFVSGGIAFTGINTSSPLFADAKVKTRMGIVIGGGIDYAITRSMSGRVEYLYTHLFDNGPPRIEDIHLYRAALVVHLNH